MGTTGAQRSPTVPKASTNSEAPLANGGFDEQRPRLQQEGNESTLPLRSRRRPWVAQLMDRLDDRFTLLTG